MTQFKSLFLPLFLAVVLELLPVNAQQNFIPGEIVTKGGVTLKGEIDFQEWEKNPHFIRFRYNTSETPREYFPSEIRYFAVEEEIYISKEVTIDQTPLRTVEKNEILPRSITETVFLKVLIEGGISLFYYKRERENFYLSYQGTTIELISHQYVVNVNGSFLISKQNELKYQRQIESLNINCPNQDVSGLAYTKTSLKKYVLTCNEINSFDVSYTEKQKKARLSNQFFTGLKYGTVSRVYIEHTINLDQFGNIFSSKEYQRVNFEPNYSLSFGYKFRFDLPKNLYRKSIGFSVVYSQYEFKSDNNLVNYVYQISDRRGISEQQFISNPVISFKSLNYKFWYARRISSGYPTFYLDFGLNISRPFDINSTADYRANQYRSTDIEEVGFRGAELLQTVEEVREINFVNPKVFLGFFGGIGFETRTLFSQVRLETFQEEQRYLLIMLGVKL